MSKRELKQAPQQPARPPLPKVQSALGALESSSTRDSLAGIKTRLLSNEVSARAAAASRVQTPPRAGAPRTEHVHATAPRATRATITAYLVARCAHLTHTGACWRALARSRCAPQRRNTTADIRYLGPRIVRFDRTSPLADLAYIAQPGLTSRVAKRTFVPRGNSSAALGGLGHTSSYLRLSALDSGGGASNAAGYDVNDQLDGEFVEEGSGCVARRGHRRSAPRTHSGQRDTRAKLTPPLRSRSRALRPPPRAPRTFSRVAPRLSFTPALRRTVGVALLSSFQFGYNNGNMNTQAGVQRAALGIANGSGASADNVSALALRSLARSLARFSHSRALALALFVSTGGGRKRRDASVSRSLASRLECTRRLE
jgi:hypothetical protein